MPALFLGRQNACSAQRLTLPLLLLSSLAVAQAVNQMPHCATTRESELPVMPMAQSMRVAVCITGRLELLPLTVDNLRNFVVKALAGPLGDDQVDIFVYSSSQTFDWISGNIAEGGRYEHYLKLLNPTKAELEADVPLIQSSGFTFCEERRNMKTTQKTNPEGYLQIMYALMRVNQMRKDRELAYGFKYDWIVRLRADVLFVQPLPAIENLLPDRITLPLFHNARPNCESCMHDRFAIGPRDLMDTFMDQYHHMDRSRDWCEHFEFGLGRFLREEMGAAFDLRPDIQFVRARLDVRSGLASLFSPDFHDGAADDPTRTDTNIHLDLATLRQRGAEQGAHIAERMELYWRDLLHVPLDRSSAAALEALGLALALPHSSAVHSAAPPDASSQSLERHVVQAFLSADRASEPFPHLYARRVLPTTVFETLREEHGKIGEWEDMMHVDAVRADKKSSSRKVIYLTDEYIDELSDTRGQQSFWRSIRALFEKETVRRAVFAALEQDESQFGGGVELLLISDQSDYKITPHADMWRKAVTVQLYLPADSSRPHLGTTLYRRRPGSPDSLEVEPFKRVQHVPNAAHGFRVGLTSFHGFPGGGMGVLKEARNSLILMYNRTIEQFVSRPYAAAECAQFSGYCPWGPEEAGCYKQRYMRSQEVVPKQLFRMAWDAPPCPAECCAAPQPPYAAAAEGAQQVYDAEYAQGNYHQKFAAPKIGDQVAMLHDLMRYRGDRPPLTVEGGRPVRVLDAGAGPGAVVHWLRTQQQDMAVEAHGVEVSAVAVERSPWPDMVAGQWLRHGSLHELPYPDRFFDLVYSHEVMEHIPAGEVPAVLRELVRVSKGRLFLTISLRLSVWDDPAAPHLHITIHPRGWWDEQFADVGCVPDLDLLNHMWRHPRGKHDDDDAEYQWHPYKEPWLFAYSCAGQPGSAAAADAAHAALSDMRASSQGLVQGGKLSVPQAMTAVLFHPETYWATGDLDHPGALHDRYMQHLRATGIVL